MVEPGEQYYRLHQEFHALTEVAKTLASPLELPALLDAVLRRIVEVVAQADVGTVMLWDQSAGLFRPEAAFGFDLEVLKEIGLRAGESITGKVYDAGHGRLLSTPEEVAEAMADMRPFNREVFARSVRSEDLPRAVLATPIATGEKRYGVLVLETLTAKEAFTDRDLPFIQTLADLIALAIDRHYLEVQLDTLRDARRSEYLRAEIMAILSHELRIPLSAIKGYSTALQLEEVEWGREKQLEFLGLIEEECDSMEVMLTEILEFLADRGGAAEPRTRTGASAADCRGCSPGGSAAHRQAPYRGGHSAGTPHCLGRPTLDPAGVSQHTRERGALFS